ncbi:TIGR03364 family FAD-dependent oxidoreductase [Lacisediminihabitans changchengi]|uniref:TIGR03364 family FAD-dependent oxidoreductase n=1 Tax=Lacisediminihabitans changchengi TaxID=2787634 RepID=A0A934W1V4_9MICO|nr:TIGR03364 family FAD-dependent oxidoreductase [Lacisediminihabitans changchengi]MBK4347268.1 TIGR03364 family FAD-dependent oxidoreductase [Lacisediminihabitans changchengi]
MTSAIASSDLLVVGAGIVGLAHASEAVRRGLSVTVIDRDSRAVGASVRNFGHCCVTAQSGDLLDLAHAARERWVEYSASAGFFSVQSGALTVARSAEELAVLGELSASREPGRVLVVSADEVRGELSSNDPAILGGAHLRDDVRVDPREAVGALATWLESQGVTFLWQTSYFGHDGSRAHTSRGPIAADRTIVCVGHDLDYLEPQLAAESGIERCGLQMTRILAPGERRIRPAVLTGTSMLRYPAFTEMPAAAALRERIAADDPDLVEVGANVMFTQRPDGTIIAGDSHRYGVTMDPFQSEPTTDVLLRRLAQVLGVPERGAGSLQVIERWQGIYASSAKQPYLVAELSPGVTAVSVTSGVGMTISFGLARRFFA